MSEYSPQAQALLVKWNCLSANMRTAVLRARYLQEAAEVRGSRRALDARFQETRVAELYEKIGLEMRALFREDGVERQFPRETELGAFGMGHFMDFRIREDAIPALEIRIDQLNDLVLTLATILCAIRI